MVRTDRSAEIDRVECIHTRVQDAVWARLSDDHARARHAALAAALEADPGCDLEAIARHHLLSGSRTRAIVFWERAAVRATDTLLAFESAALLYRRILSHEVDASPARRLAVQRKLAEALVGAGRGAEAAAAYVAASVDANVADKIELQRLASGHLMRSGHINEGLALLRQVLSDAGISMPRGGLVGALVTLWNRIVIRVRGYGFVSRDPSELPPSTLTKLDALGATSESVAWLESVAGANLNAHYLRAALVAGEPRRVVRALVGEAMYLGMVGVSAEKQADRAVAAASQIIDRLNDPGLRAWRSGLLALMQYQRGRFSDAVTAIDGAVEELRTSSSGVYFELAVLNVFRLFSLAWLGRYTELFASYREVVRDADERGNLWAACLARLGVAGAVHIAEKVNFDEMRRLLDSSLAPWKANAFGLPHFLHLLGTVELALAEGHAAEGLEAMDAVEKDLKRSLLLHSQMLRVLYTRDRARLLLAMNTPSTNARALRHARQLRKEGVSYAANLGYFLEAIALLRRGRRDDAIASLLESERLLAQDNMNLWRPVATWVRASIQGGPDGARTIEESESDLRALGVPNPATAVKVMGVVVETDFVKR